MAAATSDPVVAEVSTDLTTQRHYVSQAAIALTFRAALKRLWPTIDLTNLKATLPVYEAKVTALITQYASASAHLAVLAYEQARADAGMSVPFTTPIVDPPATHKITVTFGWVTQDLWSPKGGTGSADDVATEAAVEARVIDAAEKIVNDAGRDQMLEAVEQDRYARGFARVARPDACAFCLMLASRGAVYKTAESAGQVAASTKWADAKGNINRYHDNCHCIVMPLFAQSYEAPAHVRQALSLYEESTKNVTGSKQKLAAFRAALYAQRRDAAATT